MARLYQVQLTDAEREALHALPCRGSAKVREVTRARVLLLADRDQSDREIAAAVDLHERTVIRLRRRFAQGGVPAAPHDRPRPGAQRTLDAAGEAHLVALACAERPAGRTTWSRQLLAERLVARLVVPAISDETVRRTLNQTT